jgi:hypothetical protein
MDRLSLGNSKFDCAVLAGGLDLRVCLEDAATEDADGKMLMLFSRRYLSMTIIAGKERSCSSGTVLHYTSR